MHALLRPLRDLFHHKSGGVSAPFLFYLFLFPPYSKSALAWSWQLSWPMTIPLIPTSSPSAYSEQDVSTANRDAASELVARAWALETGGDDAGARKLVQRSLELCDSEAAQRLKAHLENFGAGSPAAAQVDRVLAVPIGYHHAVMNLTHGCSEEQLRKAYKSLSLALHPDRNHARGSEEAFKRLADAFQTLSSRMGSSDSGPQPHEQQHHHHQQRSQQQQQQQDFRSHHAAPPHREQREHQPTREQQQQREQWEQQQQQQKEKSRQRTEQKQREQQREQQQRTEQQQREQQQREQQRQQESEPAKRKGPSTEAGQPPPSPSPAPEAQPSPRRQTPGGQTPGGAQTATPQHQRPTGRWTRHSHEERDASLGSELAESRVQLAKIKEEAAGLRRALEAKDVEVEIARRDAEAAKRASEVMRKECERVEPCMQPLKPWDFALLICGHVPRPHPHGPAHGPGRVLSYVSSRAAPQDCAILLPALSALLNTA